MPADYITQVLLAGSDGSSIVPIMVDNQGRIILTGAGMQDYIPVLTWYPSAPSSFNVIARWKRVAGLVFLWLSITINDCEGKYITFISLPYPSYDQAGIISILVTGYPWVTGTYGSSIIPAGINTSQDNTRLAMFAAPVHVSGQPLYYFINGVYEALT